MPRKRKATDLYVRGIPLEFDDGRTHDDDGVEIPEEDRKVVVWVSKVNPHEMDDVLRRAQAAKARFMRASDDPDSDEYLQVYNGVREYPDRDGLVQVICAKDIRRAKDRIQAELEADDEWATDGYLQALTDAWQGDDETKGLKWRYAEEPDDPEAKRVYDEMSRFDEMANLELNAERAAILGEWEGVEGEELWVAGTKALLESNAGDVFYREYQIMQVYYGIRDIDDHTKCHFGSVNDVRTVDEGVFAEMSMAINLLTVDVVEGKGSPVIPSGSDSSELPETEEASPDSGLVESPQ